MIDKFLTVMSVCHTIVPERSHHSNKLMFQGPSPDEVALVCGAYDCGYKFTDRSPDSIQVETVYFSCLNLI